MNRYHFLMCFLPALLVGCGTPAHEKEAAKALAAAEAGRTREFLFTYDATVTGLKQGELARIWVPLPPSGEDQQVSMPERDWPGDTDIKRESVCGNAILYLEPKADRQGQIAVSTTFHVVRHEVTGDIGPAATRPSDRTDAPTAGDYPQFLQPDLPDLNVSAAKVQALLAGKKLPLDPLKAVRVLYDTALRSGVGDNADLVNLFIALVRSQGIPAKLEIGFLLSERRTTDTLQGYYCWAEVLPAGRGWIPIDISQAKAHPDKKEYYFGHLDPNRLGLSTGRGINLVPPQAGPPVELLIDPHVEVDGQPYPARLVKHTFSYRGITPPATQPAKKR